MSRQLLLVYDFPPMGGGIARWMGELARRFPVGSLIVSTGRHPDSETVDSEFPNRVDRLTVESARLRTPAGMVRWSRRAAGLARSYAVEFVWCGNLKPAAYPARWIQSRTGTPYGVMVHGGDLLILQRQARQSLLKRRAAATLLRSASVVVTNSTWTANLCRTVMEEGLGVRVTPGFIRTVPLGADVSRFRPGLGQSEVRARYSLGEWRWLLTVARLTPHKGVDTAMRALASLGSSHPQVGYLVVGMGQDLSRLQDLAKELGITDRVRFLKGVADSDLSVLYNCAEVYVGLSRSAAETVEGFGISLVEASASGLPVLATRTGGIPDAVRDGETGVLVDCDNLEQISAALRGLLDNRALASSLGAAGRRAAEEHYNWERVASDIARIGQEHAKI